MSRVVLWSVVLSVTGQDRAGMFCSSLKNSQNSIDDSLLLDTGANVPYMNNAFTSHIKGMDEDDSKERLQAFYNTASNPELQCRFRWKPGSLVFWGNRAC